MALLEARSLRKEFTTGRHTVVALDDVDLTLDAGRTLAIVGESGSGKSTFGSIVAGLQRADAGELFFDGASIGGRAYRGELRRGIQIGRASGRGRGGSDAVAAPAEYAAEAVGVHWEARST